MIDYETLYYYLGVMKQQLRKTGGFRIPYLNDGTEICIRLKS